MFYFWLCYDDGQNMSIPERHPHSKSLVLYPEALCTQAWTQMNLMAVLLEKTALRVFARGARFTLMDPQRLKFASVLCEKFPYN